MCVCVLWVPVLSLFTAAPSPLTPGAGRCYVDSENCHREPAQSWLFPDITVRARPGRLSGLSVPTVNRFCVALSYGRARCLAAQNGGSRPGQYNGRPLHYSYGTCGGMNDVCGGAFQFSQQIFSRLRFCAGEQGAHQPFSAFLWHGRP